MTYIQPLSEFLVRVPARAYRVVARAVASCRSSISVSKSSRRLLARLVLTPEDRSHDRPCACHDPNWRGAGEMPPGVGVSSFQILILSRYDDVV